MKSTTEAAVEGLAAAVVMADLSDSGQRDRFLSHVDEVAAQADGDLVLLAITGELRAVLTQLAEGSLASDSATETISDLIAAALEAAAVADAPGDDNTLRALASHDNCYSADPSVVADFVCGAAEQLDTAEELLSAAATGEEVDVNALFRCVHTLKGMSGFLSLDDLARLSHTTESALEQVRSQERSMTPEEIEQALASVDLMRTMVAQVDAGPQQPKASSKPAKRRTVEHVRVNAARLEGLLDAMGELAVAESELATAVALSKDAASIRCLERLRRIARDMQGTATALRMVSLKQTFSKMSRVVRDGVAHSGKSAELIVSGEDTEIDRAIVEGLGDPLVHLLRNAIDHGIESPEQRAAAGKPPVGQLHLRAFHRSGSVFIEIEDDGHGIDPDHLIRRATKLGVDFDRDHPLSLIFRPGFSTAEAVTEMSGRGVGMDAVAAAVASLRGQLDVSSEPGRGTRFTIRLPLTLAIIDGIVLRSGEERYVVPTHFVERTASVAQSQIVSAAGSGDILILPDGPVPVASITSTMGGVSDSGQVAVILVDGEERFALRVDEVIGQQSLVIKPLTGPPAAAAGPAGAALMGDGRVALVIDPAGLSKAMRRGR